MVNESRSDLTITVDFPINSYKHVLLIVTQNSLWVWMHQSISLSNLVFIPMKYHYIESVRFWEKPWIYVEGSVMHKCEQSKN